MGRAILAGGVGVWVVVYTNNPNMGWFFTHIAIGEHDDDAQNPIHVGNPLEGTIGLCIMPLLGGNNLWYTLHFNMTIFGTGRGTPPLPVPSYVAKQGHIYRPTQWMVMQKQSHSSNQPSVMDEF